MTKFIKLVIPTDLVNEPIIYKMVSLYQMQTNIIEARLDATSIGEVTLEINGSQVNMESSIVYLRSLGITVTEIDSGELPL